jgi:uncharacterized membrane protein (GlpM family)
MSPELIFWYGLALKMVLTAGVVVGASLAVERSGPFIGALIAALPTAAGAAYIILAVEHPPAFIARSAIGSVASNAVVSIFAAVYVVLAQRRSLFVSLGTAILVWFASAALLQLYDWTPLTAFLLNAVVFAVTVPLCRRYRTSGPPPRFLRTTFDIPLRAITSAVVVAIVTTASYSIGSFASGIFALFPIVVCSTIVILHPRIGGKAAASVLAHAQIAFVGLGLGFLVAHFFAEPLGSWWALGIGLLVCIAWSGGLLLLRLRERSRVSSPSSSEAQP